MPPVKTLIVAINFCCLQGIITDFEKSKLTRLDVANTSQSSTDFEVEESDKRYFSINKDLR